MCLVQSETSRSETTIPLLSRRLVWQNHRIHYVNNTVAGTDIRLDNVYAIHHYGTVRYLDVQCVAINRLGRLQLDHLLRQYFAWNHVIGKDCDELVFVFR